MVKINLAKAWTYWTPQTTIVYPIGESEVSKAIADKAVADGAIEGYEDGESGTAPKAGKKGTADKA